MARHVLAVAVVVVDTAILVAVAAQQGGDPRVAVLYALAATVVVVLRYRGLTLVAFAGALVLATFTGAAYILLLWTSYQAGQEAVSRARGYRLVGAALGGFTAQLAWLAPPLPTLITTYLVFVALPLLAARYLAQHRRLVETLQRHNRELRWKRELLAEQERLRERLRIARDMHDSLGRRLSLVSIQAAALEVSDLPVTHRDAVGRLAQSARDTATELHEIVGALRDEGAPADDARGVAAIDTVAAEFRAAGALVTLHRRGREQPMPAAAAHAAYRVVEEGLTNAVKHADGQPVTVNLEWESDALLLSVLNDVARSTEDAARHGHGLRGLNERVQSVGGFLEHGSTGHRFRLFAMFPCLPIGCQPIACHPAICHPAATGDHADHGAMPVAPPVRTGAVGVAVAVILFLILPAVLLLGVR